MDEADKNLDEEQIMCQTLVKKLRDLERQKTEERSEEKLKSIEADIHAYTIDLTRMKKMFPEHYFDLVE